MTDEHPAPTEPVDDQPRADDAPTGDVEPAPRRRPLFVAALAALALTVFFSAFMTVLYVRQTAARTDEQRADAARSAEIEAMRTRLKAAEQQSQWTLDPAAYEAIKKCVQQADAQRKLDEEIQRVLPTALPTAWATAIPTDAPIGPAITITAFPGRGLTLGSDLAACEEAAKYLK